MRRAFTFAEIMFAVMILGIGFIMVASMFPVAIQQAQMTQEDSAAALVAQFASQYLQRTTADADYAWSNTGASLQPLPINLKMNTAASNASGPTTLAWDKVASKMIFATDNRYAWTALYRRRPNANSAEVVIFVAQARTADTFSSNAVRPPADDTYPAMYPRRVTITTHSGGTDALGNSLGPDTIQIHDSNNNVPAFADIGAFVVTGVSTSSNDQPVRIYRLGSRVGTTDTWEMAPGYGMSTLSGSSSNNEAVTQQEAWMLGRQGRWATGVDNPAFITDNPDSPVMDIGCFATFISL